MARCNPGWSSSCRHDGLELGPHRLGFGITSRSVQQLDGLGQHLVLLLDRADHPGRGRTRPQVDDCRRRVAALHVHLPPVVEDRHQHPVRACLPEHGLGQRIATQRCIEVAADNVDCCQVRLGGRHGSRVAERFGDLKFFAVRGLRTVDVSLFAAGHSERPERQCQPGDHTGGPRCQHRLVGEPLGIGPAPFLQRHAPTQIEHAEQQRLVVESAEQRLCFVGKCCRLVAPAEFAQGVGLTDRALRDTTQVAQFAGHAAVFGESLQGQIELALVTEHCSLRGQGASHTRRITDGPAQGFLVTHHRERTGEVAALAEDLGAVAEADLEPVRITGFAAQRLLPGKQNERFIGLAAVTQAQRKVAECSAQGDRLVACFCPRDRFAERSLAAGQIALQHECSTEIHQRRRQPSLADLARLAVLVDKKTMKPQRLSWIPGVGNEAGYLPNALGMRRRIIDDRPVAVDHPSTSFFGSCPQPDQISVGSPVRHLGERHVADRRHHRVDVTRGQLLPRQFLHHARAKRIRRERSRQQIVCGAAILVGRQIATLYGLTMRVCGKPKKS